MGYLFLFIAITAEVAATSALKASEQFTKPVPSIIVIVGYGTAFYFLSLVLRSMPVGITYAVWSGMGIVLISIVAAIVFRQIPDPAAVIGIVLIISGVVIINLFSKTLVH